MNPSLHHGAFSWAELMSKDPAAANEFYGRILPWKSQLMEMEVGPKPYFLQMVDGRPPVAGIMPLPMEMPSVWAFYVTVSDVDATFAKALALGAKKEWDPMTVPGVGRMAGFLDPQGAYISIITYEAMENPDMQNPAFVDGFGIPGAFSWFALQTPDVDASKDFYAEVFGWTYRVDQMHTGPYTTFMVGDVGMGGIMSLFHEKVPPHWNAYITVDDVDRTITAIESNGGTVLMPPMDIPGVGRIAFIQDPTGGMVNIVKYVPMEQSN